MKFYQTQIRQAHVNIAKYKHIMKNIQDCYNATCLKRHKDELDSKTTIYTDDQSSKATDELQEEPQYDLDMALIDEARDQDDDHLLFAEESGNSCSLSLEPIRTYGKLQCGYQFLSVPHIIEDSVFLPTQGGHGTQGRNDEGTTNELRCDVVTRVHLMELSFRTDTSSRPNPQNKEGPERSVMIPNGTKESIIEWGQFYGLDEKQQGAFEVITSNFVLTYHIDATKTLAQMYVYKPFFK
jgi:hypothetical protein